MKLATPASEKLFPQFVPFPPPRYEGLNLNWLVLYAVGVLEEKEIDLSFENIVAATYKLFPDKYSLLGFPEYPDAKRVHDALWRCSYKDRQWLLGKTGQGFAVTERGRQELLMAKQALVVNSPSKKKTFSQTRRFEKLLAEIRTAPAYEKYSNKLRDKISEAECCHVLQGTLDSNRRVLIDNLTKLQSMATELKQGDIVEFLSWLKARFSSFLEKEDGCG